MLNTRELEKRWLKYKIKTYTPYAIIFVSIIVIIAIVSIFATDSTAIKQKAEIAPQTLKKEQKPTAVESEVVQNTPKEQNTSVQNRVNTPPKEVKIAKTQQEIVSQSSDLTQDTKLTLSPSMNFMRRMQNEEQQPYYKVTSPVNKTPKKRKIVQQNVVQEEYIDIEATNKPKTKAKTKVKREAVKVVKKEPTVEPYKKQVITIERRDSQNDIKEIIARFKKNNNPALSLFVAKKYYELGNYEQAYNYSLITNSINNDIEESWLVFAKSLVKLNRKEMAIKTLKEYIKYSHSGNARILLNDIESGKFK